MHMPRACVLIEFSCNRGPNNVLAYIGAKFLFIFGPCRHLPAPCQPRPIFIQMLGTNMGQDILRTPLVREFYRNADSSYMSIVNNLQNSNYL